MKPAGLQQLARQVAGGQEDEHEEQREQALHGLAGAGAQRRHATEGAERERGQRAEHEHDERAPEAGLQMGSDDQTQQDVDADCSAPSAATPTSRPPISETRRRGVRARRLKKPLSMSSARLVPVLISENIPPWMKATAIAKDT